MNLAVPVNATIGDGAAVIRITDDDDATSISIANHTVAESAGTATVTISLATAAGKTVMVDYATVNGTATSGADYTTTSGTATIAAGETSFSFTIPITNDSLDEADEMFDVVLSNPVNATVADGTAVVTISDDDNSAGISVADISVAENIGNATVTISLAAASGQTVMVDYTTVSATATAGADYTTTSGTATIAAGSTTFTFTVPVVDDALDEIDEVFEIALSSPVNSTIGDGTGIVTIRDDDNAAGLSVADISVSEGVGNATVTISLAAASGQTVMVDYTTVDATATAGSDYTTTSGTATIVAGATSFTFSVPVNNDTLDETDEAFEVILSNPAHATISDAIGVVTIRDDDTSAGISVADVTVAEGVGNAIVTISLAAASGQTVMVDYATTNGTAIAGTDYTATSGTATIAAGETSVTFTVPIIDDAIDEVDEAFDVTLSNAVNSTIADGTAVVTITDDDNAAGVSVADITVAEGVGNATVTISLAAPSGQTVMVDYSTVDGTGTAATDYTTTSGTATIAAGETSVTFTIPVINDSLDEADEAFGISLSNPVNSSIADGTASVTITDDDNAVSAAIADVSVTESNGVTTLTISLDAASGKDVSVDIATADGTALAGQDYIAVSPTTITIPAGQTSAVFDVTLTDDQLDEPDESFTVSIANPVNMAIGDASATVTIIDDDAVPQIMVRDVQVNEEQGTANVTISLNTVSGNPVEVDFATNSGTASSDDYSPITTTTATIAPGELTATVVISIANDLINESDETFFVDLSNAMNATLADNRAVVTIVDNDPAPNLSVSDVNVNEGGGTVTFTVSMDSESGLDVSFDYGTQDGSAVAGSDYTALALSSETIPAGMTTATVTVTVLEDGVVEQPETFDLVISNATNAVVDDGLGAATIVDNDGEPQVSIDDVVVNENAGTATVNVSLSVTSASQVSIDYTTVNGSALSVDDYTATTDTLVFAAGSTSGSITISIVDDSISEPDEQFSLVLSKSVNAQIADDTAIITISDDDSAPQISIGDVSVSEGAGTATFTVSISSVSSQDVMFFYETLDLTANAGTDYTADSGSLTIPAGQTSTAVTVTLLDDAMNEPAETFAISLSDSVNAAIDDAQAIATITDDDAAPTISVNAVDVVEDASVAAFLVTLSAASQLDVTFDYSTADGTAIAGSDYVAATGTATISAGETNVTVSVTLTNDAIDELDESFELSISNPMNSTIDVAAADATIIDDDELPTVSIADATLNEGDGSMVFTISLDATSGLDVTVDFATSDGTATSADYDQATGSVSIPAGKQSATISVDLMDDALDEANETFSVAISNATNGMLGNSSATGTILDDDPAVIVSVSDVSVTEGDSDATFVISLDAVSSFDVTFDYATADGTAVAGEDFEAVATSTTTIPAGQISTTVSVKLIDDLVVESAETFVLNLSNVANASRGQSQGTASVADNDTAPAIAVDDITIDENAGTAIFTVSLSAATGSDVTVDYEPVDQSAIAGSDYVSLPVSTLTISAGSTSATVSVTISDDALNEIDETFGLQFTNPVNATLDDTLAVATITDNDAVPVVSIGAAAVKEGASSTAEFIATLSEASGRDVSVSYTTADGQAEAGSDYVAANGSVTIPAGETSATVSVSIVDDSIPEAVETFSVNLSDSINAAIADGTGTATISDNDVEGIGDIDFDGSYRALTDGILGIRHMAQFRGSALIANAVDDSGQRTGAPEVADWIQTNLQPWFDADGDGSIKPLTDGVLFVRYLAGFRGNALIAGAVEQGASRSTATEVEAWLAQIVGDSAASGPVAVSSDHVSPNADVAVASVGNDVQRRTSAVTDSPNNVFLNANNSDLIGPAAAAKFVAGSGTFSDAWQNSDAGLIDDVFADQIGSLLQSEI